MPKNQYAENHIDQDLFSLAILDAQTNVSVLQLIVHSYSWLPKGMPFSFSYPGVSLYIPFPGEAESENYTPPTPKELPPGQIDRLYENFRHVGTWQQYEILELLKLGVHLAEVTIPWLDQFREDLDLKV